MHHSCAGAGDSNHQTVDSISKPGIAGWTWVAHPIGTSVPLGPGDHWKASPLILVDGYSSRLRLDYFPPSPP